MPEPKDVTASSPELKEALEGATPAPVTEPQTQETQDTTAEPSATQEQEQPQTEEARVPYSRLKEVVDEKNYFRQLWEQDRQRQLAQQQFHQPQTDPYAGMTPEERVFWQNVDSRAEQRARQIIEKEIKPVIDAGRMEIARMSVSEFRREFPDVKPNSPEEIAIAEKIQSGYIPRDAYYSVMGPLRLSNAEERGKSVAKQQVKQQMEAKKKANVEQSGLPSKTGLPETKLSLRQRIEANYDKMMSGEL